MPADGNLGGPFPNGDFGIPVTGRLIKAYGINARLRRGSERGDAQLKLRAAPCLSWVNL
jgi:hypothetical protein